MECLLKYGQIYDHEGALSTTNWHWPREFSSNWITTREFAICLCRDWTFCCCSCWPSTSLGEFRVEWDILLQGIWWNRSLDRYFQELISWSQSLHLFITGKALNPFMMTSAEWWPAENPLWNKRLIALNSPFTMGFPGVSEGKASACNAGNQGLIPGSGRAPEEGNGNPLGYSCLENPMDGEDW